MTKQNQSPEMSSLKQKLKDTWSAGDFGYIARSYEKGARDFVFRTALKSGQKVLDLACGTGNLSFAASASGAEITGIDIAPNLVAQAKERANREGLEMVFDEGDAESLPYSDSSFDVVLSMFGAMFAPRPELVVSELLRVTSIGGHIHMANWTSEGFIGKMFKTIADFVPPPAIMPSPLLWGDENVIGDRFSKARSQSTERRMIAFEFDMVPEKVVSFWREYYGPTQRAFAALDGDSLKQQHLFNALCELWKSANTSENSTVVESEYLEVVVHL